jgi:glycosyltransferase involved in cell wall biosynthesis
MRIGIDCRTILNPTSGERAGVGHYTYNLVKQVIHQDTHNEYVLYFDYRMHDVNDFARENVTVKHFPFSQYGKFLSFGYSHMLIAAYLMKEGLDLYHVPAGNIPLTYPKKVLYTVHDLAIYKNSEWFPSQILSRHVLTPRSLKAADHLIAVSKSTKHDIKELFNIPDKKISVIYEGADVKKIPLKRKKLETIEKFNLPEMYFLFIGTLEPRKNLITLIRAYKKFLTSEPSHANIPLVVAGSKGYKSSLLFEEVKELGIKKAQFRYFGYVSHNEKIELLRHARAFVFPTLYEGFGIPVLAALSVGTPVISSNTSSIPEIVGSAGVLMDPEDEHALVEAMKSLVHNEQLFQSLKQKGLAQAKNFSWERSAKETIALYTSITKKNHKPSKKS